MEKSNLLVKEAYIFNLAPQQCSFLLNGKKFAYEAQELI